MITLYQFPSVWGLPNASPFCMKLETYLRMVDLEYVVKTGDPRSAPKKKLPYIEDGGVQVCDSNAIVHHLKKAHGDKLDADLTEQQRALAHVIRRMVEEGLYWTLVYSRWADDAGWELAEKDLLRPVLPALLRSFLPGIIRKGVVKQIYAQGTGRHTREEIYDLGKADLDALSTLLADQPFFLGQKPTSVDASAYGFLGIILWAPPGSPLTEALKSHPNLVAYCERMKARYYGDAKPS